MLSATEPVRRAQGHADLIDDGMYVYLYLGSILMLKRFAKNSSNQAKKTCLSSGEIFVQSITSSACGPLPEAGISGRVDRLMGGGPDERLGKLGGGLGDRVGRGGAGGD